MRHTLAALFGLLTLTACNGCGAWSQDGLSHPASPAAVVRGEDARAVLLTGLTPLGGYYCSGVLVSATQVVTAAHCAMEDAVIMATREDGSMAFLEIEVLVPGRDLARLKVAGEIKLAGVTVGGLGDAPERVRVGPAPTLDQRLCISAAYPRRDHKCGDLQFTPDADGMMYFDAIVEHGNSGGGVYDTSGRLVAIVDVLYDASNGQVMGTGARTIGADLVWLVRP